MLRPPRIAGRRSVVSVLIALSVACTATGPTPSSPADTASGSTATPSPSVAFDLDGRTYRSECLPVPEALLDIKLANAGSPSGLVRAITGIPAIQGVAVPSRWAGCGTYSFALVDGLHERTAEALRAEIRAEDQRFD